MTPATLTRRLAAAFYDALLVLTVVFIGTLMVNSLRGGTPVPPGTLWFQAYVIGLVYLFFGWFWTHGGQTLGMRAWKIRVVRADGRPLDWPTAALRLTCALLAWAPAGLGVLWLLADRERRAWHDRLSATRVIRID